MAPLGREAHGQFIQKKKDGLGAPHRGLPRRTAVLPHLDSTGTRGAVSAETRLRPPAAAPDTCGPDGRSYPDAGASEREGRRGGAEAGGEDDPRRAGVPKVCT